MENNKSEPMNTTKFTNDGLVAGAILAVSYVLHIIVCRLHSYVVLIPRSPRLINTLRTDTLASRSHQTLSVRGRRKSTTGFSGQTVYCNTVVLDKQKRVGVNRLRGFRAKRFIAILLCWISKRN